MAETVFNEGSINGTDFRIESDDNANMFFVDGADDRIGIGTNAPEGTLHIKEGAAGHSWSLNGSGTHIFLEANGANAAGMTLASGTGANGFIIFADTDSNYQGALQYDHSTSRMHFTTAASQRMTIDSNGDVGINNTNPETLLHLKNTAGIELRLEADSDNSGQEDCFIRFYTDNKMQEGVCGMDNNNTDTRFTTNTENAMVFGCVSNLPVVFATNSTERMQIAADGKIFVGSTASRALSGVNPQIQLEGTSYDTSSMSLIGNTGTSSGAAPIIFFGRSRGTSDNSSTVAADGDRIGALFFCGADGTDINTVAASIEVEVDGTPGSNDMPGRIVFKTNSGTSAATARWNIPAGGAIIPEADNTYNIGSSARQVSVFYTANSVVVSDETKKENIKDCDLGSDFIKTLKPKSYNIKGLKETHDDYNKKHYGLIAQDLKDGKLKDSVFGDKDGEYGLNYNDLIAPLIKAVQELSVKVETLEVKVEDLEKKNVMRFGN
jgi:hypothetical protein